MAGMNSSSFDYTQYKADSLLSKEYPLPRKTIIDGQVEVFALSGYEFAHGRYVLSLTSCAEAVDKPRRSMYEFLKSKRFKAKWGKAFECSNFEVEGSQRSISGVPLPVARLYWRNEDRNDNPKAEIIIDALTEMTLETLCDAAFGIARTAEATQARFRSLLYTPVALEWCLRFRPEYYEELYRIFPSVKRPTLAHHRPSLFGRITKEYFYELFPGRANDFFDRHNSEKKARNHQFLTEKGSDCFDRIMTGFLIFLRGVRPGDFKSFVTAYNNTFTQGFQNELF